MRKVQSDLDRRGEVIEWIRDHAHSLITMESEDSLIDLAALGPMVSDSKIIGFGESTRGARNAHQLYIIKHQALRFLVESLNFRSLVLEMHWALAIQLNEYLRTGNGDPRILLSRAWGPLQTEEVLEVILWMRSYNQQNPSDSLQIFGGYSGPIHLEAFDVVFDYVQSTAPERMEELKTHFSILRPSRDMDEHAKWYSKQQNKQAFIDHAQQVYILICNLPTYNGYELAIQYARFILEFYEHQGIDNLSIDQRFAKNIILWHKHTGNKIVYWGGIGHTANNNMLKSGYSQGSYLRDYFGKDYVSIGLTFHYGLGQNPISFPPSDFVEAVLSKAKLDMYILDLHVKKPESVKAWLNTPTKVRAIGPYYDPQTEPPHINGLLSSWFDILLHTHEVTPAISLK
ncbi:erythromycin esterase family protein [Shimazuella kribbensis]|uniref:erythromycin esterase family protein n=1 Tax=Shimazuella kribbensis TaxID=139808 RepID=UPI00040635E9|nr:erythromycin esterase family protein [Shimazuella kribbensis]